MSKSEKSSHHRDETPSTRRSPGTDTPKAHSGQKSEVTLFNRSQNPVELDFGRDHEVRIGPREHARMDAKYLSHPEFLRHQGSLQVS